MWIIRFLNGPQAGQIVPLNKPNLLVGRSARCDVKIQSNGVSKEHLKIDILGEDLLITDAGSRNGTFLNGVQIKSAKVKSGDQILLHNLTLEVQNVPEQWAQQYQMMQALPNYGSAAPNYGHPNPAPSSHERSPSSNASFEQEGEPLPPKNEGNVVQKILDRAQQMLDKEVLPGVYKLPESMEFKWVLAGFMAVFIFVVTSLSTIPLIRILKMSIEEESQQHALTIATTLAKINRPALLQGMDSTVSVDMALNRPGVKDALIISNIDGQIIAPANKAGTFPDEPYVHQGRKLNKESVNQYDDSTVIAMVPIEFYNSQTGTQAVTAFAVVFYDMGSLAIDDSQVLSLFITTLFIALLIGSILFYFLFKIFEYPFVSLNAQIDQALKEGHDQVSIHYQFSPLQKLASNLGSALSRVTPDDGFQQAPSFQADRNKEIENLVQMSGFGAMGISALDLSILSVNEEFEHRTGVPVISLQGLTVNEINDQALKLNIKDLIERVDANPYEMAHNELEFSGHPYQLVAQGIAGDTSVATYLVILIPLEEGG
tara:strand:+ start:19258 stop:20886 length:1629 start_codon:yes stop_codon:yes gene_type:complete